MQDQKQVLVQKQVVIQTIVQKQKLKYQIKCRQDINQYIIKQFKKLVDILVVKFGVTQKIDQGDKNQIISHLQNIYPTQGKIYNQNFYFTIAYHKLLYILYKKNKHVSLSDPNVQIMFNKQRDMFRDTYSQKKQTKAFIKFLQGKLLQLNSKFNKSYYLTIIKKLCQFLQNPQDAPFKRRDIIKQIRQGSFKSGKRIPKNYIYRVFYILKKNFKHWKKEYEMQLTFRVSE